MKPRFIYKVMCSFGILLCQNAQATSHSIITLKNGSEIKGDIVVQRFGNDLTIESETAVFVIEPNDIVSKKTRKVNYDDLSRELKRWVLENRALKGDAYGRYAELEDIKTDKYSFYGLISKQHDDKGCSYVQVSKSTFNIKWDDIRYIKKNTSGDIKYGLIDNIITLDGKNYKGKILSQRAGENVVIETTEGHVTIPNVKIIEIRKVAPKDSDSWLDYIDFTNIVLLKDGSEKEGLIIANHFGKKITDNYVVMLDLSGKSETILNSNISEIHTKYVSDGKSLYTPDQVYLNEFKVKSAKSQRLSNGIVFLEKQVFPFPEGICITFKSEGGKLAGDWRLVALSEFKTSDGKSSWGYDISKKEENTINLKSAV